MRCGAADSQRINKLKQGTDWTGLENDID